MGFLSKLTNAFKSLRLNQKNAVSGQALDYLLVGSMYAEQQSAYLNSYETGLNKSDIKKLVETYWEISNQNQAIEILQSLHIRNQDKNIEFVCQAFENKAEYVAILKSNLPKDEESFEYYLNIYRKLSTIIPELIGQKVIANFSQIKEIKDSGWNYGRSVFLARCCYELEYLSEIELKDYIAKSHSELKKYCSTWQEYTISYIFGRAIWGGGNNDGMILIAKDLLNKENSPLKNKTYI